MEVDTEFDLKVFQSEVFKDLDNVRLLCSRPFRYWQRLKGRRTEAGRDFIRKEQKATQVVRNRKVNQTLCREFRKHAWSHLFREGVQARMVAIVTASLLSMTRAEEIGVERDIRLFSLIILKIFENGSSYCSPVRGWSDRLS